MFTFLMSRCCGNRTSEMFFAGFLLATASVLVRAEESGNIYRSTIEAQAAKAEQSGDAIQMINVAFALYPLDAQKGVADSRSAALVNKAVEIALKKNDRALAGKVLELSSPISGQVAAEKRSRLEELAVGKSVAEQVVQQTDKTGADLKKYGPDFGNPEIKGRGDVEKQVAETLGNAVLYYCRPSAPLSNKGEVKLTNYKYEQLKGDRLKVTAEIRWYGFFTGDPYDSEIEIVILNDDPPEVLSISYDDDCPTPCENLRKINELIRLLNKQFRK